MAGRAIGNAAGAVPGGIRFFRMRPADLEGTLDFLRAAERLKATHRSAYTSDGERESAAEHSWRLCLMALVLAPEFPDVDLARLLKICIVHDLGEAVHGDIPAPEQARRLAEDPAATKSATERRDLLSLVARLPEPARGEIVALWDEYETAATPEARLAKALDKLETILQHTQGANPPDFDYRFNLGYGRRFTTGHPVLDAMREILDRATEQRAVESEGPQWKPPGIRRARMADAAALAVFAERTFRETYEAFNTAEDMTAHVERAFGEEKQRAEIMNPDGAVLVAEHEGSLVAYAQLRWTAVPGCVSGYDPMEIHRFYVDRAWHGRGVAARLMEASRRSAAELGAGVLWLGVWERNPRAIAFYKKCGFADVGEWTFTLGNDVQRDRVLQRSVRDVIVPPVR